MRTKLILIGIAITALMFPELKKLFANTTNSEKKLTPGKEPLENNVEPKTEVKPDPETATESRPDFETEAE